ncbi:GNAT family N-acetyltransferase [Kitasatospora viridis]|uniref:RimJ/RimL family protein N-acetyltransferase n=1 Tax=Kitasatospora viridis TaxID=281105 RepID=A0A561UPQ1_9ACTN|nr:GNAT family protein [Kitasatospora viridis]TWG01324.1 RimJ/RimL family protein N-acetyltransferase [Kitasatospora viridis]
MLSDHWPPLGLRLTTPRLELRLPTEPQLAALAELAAAGVHEPDRMPFINTWTDLPPTERARSVVQHHWLRRGNWTPQDWSLNLVVLRDGEVLGLQSLWAREFAVKREVHSGSWLGLAHHGQGVGTEMRAAVLHLAFAGLGALTAGSGYLDGNEGSAAVSRRLGYRPDGTDHYVVRGARVASHRLRLSREDWEAHRSVPVAVAGLTPCLPLFGLTGHDD